MLFLLVKFIKSDDGYDLLKGIGCITTKVCNQTSWTKNSIQARAQHITLKDLEDGYYSFKLTHYLQSGKYVLTLNNEDIEFTLQQIIDGMNIYVIPAIEEWYKNKYYETWNKGFYIGIAGFIVSVCCLIYIVGVNIKQVIYNRPMKEQKEDFYEP
jgi:hypothetical protein